MTPIEHLRAADPARDLRLDDRAERELAALLATASGTRPTAHPASRRRPAGPVLVTALVAAVVIVLTAVVLTVVRPRTDVATTPPTGSCAAAEAYGPFCGPYRSTGGTGALAALRSHPYGLTFSREDGLTLILDGDCDVVRFAVRPGASTLEVGRVGATSSCSGEAATLHASLMDRIESSDVGYRFDGDSLTFTFGAGADTASFLGVPRRMTPPYVTTGCRPTEALPFRCGTYRSTDGGAAIGDGPKTDPLSISFVPQRGALVLMARWGRCTAASVPVRYENGRLVHIGEVLVGQLADEGCRGVAPDTTGWASAFLRGDLTTRDGVTYGSGDSEVLFEHQGGGELGERQFPRNDRSCVAAHVEPFGCGTYRSVSGTGALAFLGPHPTELAFAHLNGELTANFSGWCNALNASVATDGGEIVSYGVGGTQRACGRMPLADGTRPSAAPSELRDEAWRSFFSGVMSFAQDGDSVTFTKGADSATFRRD